MCNEKLQFSLSGLGIEFALFIFSASHATTICACSGDRARCASTSDCERAPQTAASGRSTASRRPTKRRDLWPRAGAQRQKECGRTQAIAGAAYGRERVLWRQAFSASGLGEAKRQRAGAARRDGCVRRLQSGCDRLRHAASSAVTAWRGGDERRAAATTRGNK